MGRTGKASATPSMFDADETAVATRAEPEFPLSTALGAAWREALAGEAHQPYWNALQQFVAAERTAHTVYPPAEDVFNAFRYTPLEDVRVFLLGQDPYPGAGQAHGLCFSVRPGVRLPGSLRNIYKELHDDLGIAPAKHGYLVAWAKRGVLMLNACLTVRVEKPNSHAGKGWEKFTDAALRAANGQKRRIVFVLWGAYAQKKIPSIDQGRHVVVKSAHPSPLSAANGFFGSKPFSKVNAALAEAGEKPIDWRLPEKADEEQS
jgi:uracil-DNA glycosylase